MTTYAVIEAGGKQHIVTTGDELDVEMATDKKSMTFEPLAVFDDKNTTIGTPHVAKATVKASVEDSSLKGPKVTSIRYKAKKRVKTIRGHRQPLIKIKITDISS